MAGASLKLALVLAAFGSSLVAADVFPRQTTFSNATTSSTATGTASGVPTPAPCCWILAGTRAVGLNKWYTSTAEHVVGELIVSFLRHVGLSCDAVMRSRSILLAREDVFM